MDLGRDNNRKLNLSQLNYLDQLTYDGGGGGVEHLQQTLHACKWQNPKQKAREYGKQTYKQNGISPWDLIWKEAVDSKDEHTP